MKAYSIRLDGPVLERGFWLYVIDIRAPQGDFLYVGRTGDSPSPNASSPFSRIAQHLDCRLKAKGNALTRNLRHAGIQPSTCNMEMIAIGPIFSEEKQFPAHRLVRNKMAALEKALASVLRDRGYVVLGQHASAGEPDPKILDEVTRLVEARLEREHSA